MTELLVATLAFILGSLIMYMAMQARLTRERLLRLEEREQTNRLIESLKHLGSNGTKHP